MSDYNIAEEPNLIKAVEDSKHFCVLPWIHMHAWPDDRIMPCCIADSAEPKSIKEITRYGFRVTPAKKGKDSILYGINILQEYRIRLTKRSTNIINEFDRYEWKKDREGNATNTPIDNHNHAIDGIRYLAMSKLGQNKSRRPF